MQLLLITILWLNGICLKLSDNGIFWNICTSNFRRWSNFTMVSNRYQIWYFPCPLSLAAFSPLCNEWDGPSASCFFFACLIRADHFPTEKSITYLYHMQIIVIIDVFCFILFTVWPLLIVLGLVNTRNVLCYAPKRDGRPEIFSVDTIQHPDGVMVQKQLQG